ncbi:DNA glycosylase [Venturia nashicola]|uniref:DNA glycosylase n=1 Tax=Venturia nashicola TaxID=86259 RepID=A0A4Z1PD99_9PEZI|nr:DNA glycosylase [Venturia nashicola]
MAQLWLPRDLVLETDLVERLFAWHGTLPEHHEACRNDFFEADRKDLQYLMQPLVNALPAVSGKGGKTLQAKAERALLVSTDLDLMWEAFGPQTKVERKDFRQCIETAPQDVFIGLIQYYAKLGDMSPLNFRAMNIEAARQAWAEDSWRIIDNGLARFLAKVRKGRNQTRTVAAEEAAQRQAIISPSSDVDMPSSPPIRTTIPRTTRAPTIPTPQTEDNRIADGTFARATGHIAAGKPKRVTSTEGMPNTSRKGIEDEALARAMGHSTARKTKPSPSTKGAPDPAQNSFKGEAVKRASGNITAVNNSHVQSTVGTPKTVPKSFADEAFARAMDSAAGKRKRAPSKEKTPDPANKETHKPKRQRLTKDASVKSSRNSLVVSQVEIQFPSPVPVPAIASQKTPQKPPQQAASERSIPKENAPREEPIKKEMTSKARPARLRELPGSREVLSAKRSKAAEPLSVEKSKKKTSSLNKAPQNTLNPQELRQKKVSRRENVTVIGVTSKPEKVSALLHQKNSTASEQRHSSKATKAALEEKETAKVLKYWRTEEKKYWTEMEQRATVVDECETIEYWRRVEAEYLEEEERLRNQQEPVLLPPGSQESHRLELEKILEQRRIAEEKRFQQRSQQKDASRRRKSQTGAQEADKKRRKQTKNRQRKQRREAQAALARLQNRSLSPVKRRREATGTASPPPVCEVDDWTQADEFSSPMQDAEMIDSSRVNMSGSQSQTHIEIENEMSNAVETSDAQVLVQKPKTSSHKKQPKSSLSEPKACRTCNAKHRRCDRKGPMCGECTKNGRECVWSSDTAKPIVLAPAKPAKEQNQDEEPAHVDSEHVDSEHVEPKHVNPEHFDPEHVEPDRDEEPRVAEQTGLVEELNHEETPEERDMRQLASQLTTTQDEPASSTLLPLASPSHTAMPILPPARNEPIVQAHEGGYTSSQASILARSKANIIARMTSRQASTASEVSDRDDHVEEEVQPETTLPLERRLMVAVAVRPATFFGRLDSEDPEAGIGATEVPIESGTEDEELGFEVNGPVKPASLEILEDVNEDMGADVVDVSDLSREGSEDLILHDMPGYDSADAEDEDLRDSEEEDEVDASGRRPGPSRRFVNDLASENSDEEGEEAENGRSENDESEDEREEEQLGTPAVNWGESSDDEEDNSILGKQRVDVHNVAASAQDRGTLVDIDAKPVVAAQTQTPESENADAQRSGQDVDMYAKLYVPADEFGQEVESSAQIDDVRQGSNNVLARDDLNTNPKPQSPIFASFDSDKHRSLRESLVYAIQRDDDSEQEIDTKVSLTPRFASPELGDTNLLALSPSIFSHNLQSPPAKEDIKHILEVAESVYDDDDAVQYPELGDKLGTVSEEEPEDDVMDVDYERMASVGDRPLRAPIVVDEESLETPAEEPDNRMIDDDSDFSDDDLTGAEQFPRSRPLEEYPDDVKFEPSQLEAMSPPERLTQLQLPDLPPGMVASQYPAVLYPPLPMMGNVFSSPGEGDITAITAIEHTQSSPATSSSDDASAVTALEYSQQSPEAEPPEANFGPTHTAENVNKNMVPKSYFFNPMIRSAWPTMRMGRNQELANGDDWATIVPRTCLRSWHVRQETTQEDPPSSTRSFRESQGLVRCSIKKIVNETEKSQKKKKKAKSKKQKMATVMKTQNSDVVFANTQVPSDSPDIKCLRSQSSEQVVVLETQSPSVPDSVPPKADAGPAYNACSTRGIDFTWEREYEARQQTPSRPLVLASQHGSDEAISPEKIAAFQPPSTPSKRKTGKASSFFDTPSPKKPRPAAGTVSCIDVPPLSNSVFGLIQEELAHSPFQLLVAVVFLNKTRGKYAIPIFHEVIGAYPTAQALEKADPATLSKIIKPLGLFNQRAATLVNLAKVWNLHPPTMGRRVMTPKYPNPGSHKGIGPLEVLGDDDEREGALEIGHLPGIGAYAFDSWRIFCRDELRAVATDWNGGGTSDEGFVPEWKRVLPNDKELRAYLRWMWLKEGVKWNPLTGEKEIASAELLSKAELGGLDWDEVDAM